MARYEFSEGKSNKFWEIHLSGNAFTVRYGRIGTSGQEQTKDFTSPDLARKEHDNLVAEKTKKGYTLVGSAAAPEPPPPAKSAPATTALRKDFYVYNDSTGMMVLSKRIGGIGWDNGGREWEKGVRNGDIIPLELYQDDSFVIRVVVGGELEKQEADEWTGRLDWKLRVPDGNLVVCGGSEYVMEELDEEDSYMSDYVRHMKIPKGEYRASLYMYLGSVNGRPCLRSAKDGDEPDPLGEWFRRTRPNEKFPAWLHNDCVDDPREDPGHEKEWKKAKKVEDPNEYYVEFLLHLTPLETGAKVELPELTQGWFSTPTQCRVPEKIPLGIPAAKDIEGAPKKEDPNAVYPIDVFKHTQKFKRTPLKGGPVEVPLEHLERLFRIPWFCHIWTAPELKIELPKNSTFSADGERLEKVAIKRDGDVLYIGFQNPGSQSGCIRSLASVAPRLKSLPDGAVIELDAVYAHEPELKREIPMALHRYRGTARGGKMLIEETFPEVKAERLKDALALSAQVENCEIIDAGTAEICNAAMASLKGHAFFSDNPAVKIGATSIGLKKSEPVMMNFVAVEIFKHSFKDTWRILDLDAVSDDEDEEEEEKQEDTGRKLPPKALRGEVVLEEKNRKFYLSDATKMDADCQKKIEATEKELLPLGFKFVADVTLTEMEYGLIRAYAQPGGSVWAALTLAPFGRGTFEFVEFYQDGGALTTTTNSMVRDEIFRDAYKSVRGNLKIPDMWKDHQQRSTYLAEFHGGPRKLDATARGLAADVQTSIKNQEQKQGRKPLLLKGDENRTIHSAEARTIHPDAPKMIIDADALMKKLGYEPIGDAVSSFFSSWVYRGYVKPGGDIWAMYQLEASTVSPPCGRWEFVTHYEKGAVLQSCAAAMSKDEPKRKIFRILDPKSSGADLLTKHEKRKPELVAKWGAPLKTTGDMKSLAAEVEACAVRIMG